MEKIDNNVLVSELLYLFARCLYTNAPEKDHNRAKELRQELTRRLEIYDATTRPHPEVPGPSDAGASRPDYHHVDFFGDSE